MYINQLTMILRANSDCAKLYIYYLYILCTTLQTQNLGQKAGLMSCYYKLNVALSLGEVKNERD